MFEFSSNNCFAQECYLGTQSINLDQLEDMWTFAQCFAWEEKRNDEIMSALNAIEDGAEFAFYALDLSEREQQLLSEIKITAFNNLLIQNASMGFFLKQEIREAILKMDGVNLGVKQIDDLSSLTMRIANTIIGQAGAKNFELYIRTMDGYKAESSCTYWHLDKSREEVLGGKSNGLETRFIIPLKGVGTNYRKIDIATRSRFLEVANEHARYYGRSAESCMEGDILNSLRIYKPEIGFGSVHIASVNGAMHSEPNESSDRLLLIITPIEQQ